MRRQFIHMLVTGTLVSAASAILAAGCSSDDDAVGGAQLAAGCSLNSDCQSPLVCAFQKCHSACEESADCPSGATCVKGSSGNVCRLAEETRCTYTSDCPQPLACAVDQQCRNQCQTDIDCVAGQKCATGGWCANPADIDPSTGGLRGARDAGTSDAGDAGHGGAGGDGGSTRDASDGATVEDASEDVTVEDASEAAAEEDASDGATTEDAAVDGATGDDDAATEDASDGAADDAAGDEDATVDATLPEEDAGPLTCASGTADCNGVRTDGCEVTLATDAKHCGVCTRDCTSIGATTCSAGACEALGAGAAVYGYGDMTFGGDGGGTRTFAYGGGYLYWMGVYSYTIRRYALSGSDSQTLYVGANMWSGAESLIVTDSQMIWAERASPSAVLARPLGAAAGEMPTPLFYPEYVPTYLTLSNGYYYWTSGDSGTGDPGGYIYRRATADGSGNGTKIVTVDQGKSGSIYALAVTSNAVYWATTGSGDAYGPRELRTVPLAGGTPTVVPSILGSGPIDNVSYQIRPTLRAEGDTLYFTRMVDTSFANGIYKYRKGDTEPSQLVSANRITSFIMDDEAFYVLKSNENGVWKAPRSGGQLVKISAQMGAKLVAQDDQAVYLLEAASGNSRLYKVLK